MMEIAKCNKPCKMISFHFLPGFCSKIWQDSMVYWGQPHKQAISAQPPRKGNSSAAEGKGFKQGLMEDDFLRVKGNHLRGTADQLRDISQVLKTQKGPGFLRQKWALRIGLAGGVRPQLTSLCTTTT